MFLLSPDIFFWDLGILLFLTTGMSLCIAAWVTLRRGECGWFGNIVAICAGCLGLTGALLTAYGSFVEPQIIVVNSHTVTHPLGQNMRIAVISDLHVGPYKHAAFVQKTVDAVNATLPDMVLLPGDFILGESPDLSALAALQDLRAPLGVFGVLGNHDMGEFETLFGERYTKKNRGEEVATSLAKYGVRMLRNDHVIIPVPDGVVAVAGVDDIWTGHADISQSLSGIPDGAYVILLSHNPSIIDDSAIAPAHLIVSGHTHGGQLRLPLIGPLARIPVSIGQEFDEGMFPLQNGGTLAITRGVGESSARARLFAWPEVMVVEIGSK